MNILLLILLLVIGCFAADPKGDTVELPAGAPLRGVIVEDDDDFPDYTDEDRAEAAEFMRGFTPTYNDVVFDDMGETQIPKALSGVIEKDANYPALTGWGMKGSLAFQQDGTLAHCALFGLSCDDEWHAQTRTLNLGFQPGRGFMEEYTGRGCATGIVEDGTSELWMPCAVPNLTETDRALTWHFAEETCTASNRGRRAVHDGFQAAAAYLTRYSSVSLEETSDRTTATFLVVCNNNLPAGTSARMEPQGELTLRYGGLKGFAGLTTITYDQCETSGLPGYLGFNYPQGLDFVYSYDYATISINWDAQFTKIAECTSDPTEMARVWRNTFMHEIGHFLGFLHEGYQDLDFGVMQSERVSCDVMATYSWGFDDLHLSAILSQDVDPDDGDLIVWDQDLSCYNPDL